MEIRRIKKEEKVYASMVQTIAFLGSHDYTEELKNPEEHYHGYETTWGAFNDKGKLTSCFEVIPYDMMFDGNVVKMAGIGGVASLPEERNKGMIRGIFEKSMQEMKDVNQIFSYLFPFSHEYYRMFGYEICYDSYNVSIPISALQKFKKSGSFTFYNKGDDISDIKKIYSDFIKDKNLAIVRTDSLWEGWVQKDPFKDKQYTYTWHNDNGEPKSYVIFTPEWRNHEGTNIKIKEFVWSDIEGFQGMLGALARFRGQYSDIKWTVPDNLNVHAIFPEPYNVDIHVNCSGMNRVVDVEACFKLLRVPVYSGAVAIHVEDNFMPFNTGTYEISWEGGKSSVKKTDRDADMSISVQTLVQIVTGYIDPKEAALAGKAEIKSNLDKLCELFPKKYLYMTDRF